MLPQRPSASSGRPHLRTDYQSRRVNSWLTRASTGVERRRGSACVERLVKSAGGSSGGTPTRTRRTFRPRCSPRSACLKRLAGSRYNLGAAFQFMFYIARRVDFEGKPNNDANGARYLHFGVLSKLGGLAAALARGPHHCALVFPKIIGSTLGNYETLASGLIAASAVLFAGVA